MKNDRTAAAKPAGIFPSVTESQIETVNLRRIMVICLGTLAFEIINLLNPNFWSTPILWIGAIYLSAISIVFLLLIFLRKSFAPIDKPELLNALFWTLFSIGFFPFLVRDARAGDSPLNCVLLCTVLICAPLLRVKNLRIIFSGSVLVNLLAAWYARGSLLTFQYALELVAINAVGFFMAQNLHGRYFSLLDEQQRMYDRQLADKLAQEALQSQLEKDRLINESRSEFLSRMSHDLRTPLNAVIGLSGIAMDESLSREQIRGYLGDINRSARHLLSLINDVLDMSKLENGKMVLRPEPYRVSEFLETVRSVIGVQCEQQKILFEASVDEQFPSCLLVDRLRFNQIYLNLLSNAMKFTPAGGRVSLRLSHEPLEDGKIRLSSVVEDTGKGMTPEFAAHAFDAFAQEDTTDGELGTGLGLTIVKNIVSLMDGTIDLESRLDSGTTVTVRLVCPTAVQPETPPPDDSFDPAVLRGRRVLLCEDNHLNQEVASLLLEKAGILVEIAENGKAGVDRFSQSPPNYYDAVLMDVRMPVMDGITATLAIRGLPRADAATVPVIAMTADAYEEDVKRSRASGMNCHLSKPIEPQTLYETLSHFLSARSPDPSEAHVSGIQKEKP